MKDCGFDLNNVVGQDSVAGMSRALSGVQKIVRDKTPCGFLEETQQSTGAYSAEESEQLLIANPNCGNQNTS